LAQYLRWTRDSTPQNTPVFLRVESLIRLDLDPKTYFLDNFYLYEQQINIGHPINDEMPYSFINRLLKEYALLKNIEIPFEVLEPYF
jgi:hypothetical protein